MSKRRAPAEKRAIELLKKRGYIIKKETKYVLKTYEIDEELLKKFQESQRAHNLKVKEAINTAIRDFIDRYDGTKTRKN